MDRWDVGIDVSNVCRDPALGGASASFDRLDRVVTAWRQQRSAGCEVHLVADRSLRKELDPRDVRRWDQLVRDGSLEVHGGADDPLLTWAAEHERHVLSRDQFLDHRRAHSWIQQHPERFHQWRVTGEAVDIVPGPIARAPEALISQAIERKELAQRRLDPAEHWNLLNTRWRCTNPTCFQAQLWPDHLLVWPEPAGRGLADCPSCGRQLTNVGRRGRTVQIVVEELATGQEVLRFPLEHGRVVALGRGRPRNVDPSGAIDVTNGEADRFGQVSRTHASLELRNKKGPAKLTVIDLGSRGGTLVRTDGRSRPVPVGDEEIVRPGDRVELARQLSLRVSGVRFLADDQPPAAGGTSAFETIWE